MADYEFVDKNNTLKTVTANSPEEAIRNAPDRAATSGVSLVQRQAAQNTTPPPPTQGNTGSSSTDTGSGSTNGGTLTDRYSKDKKKINDTFGVVDKPDQEAIREMYRQRAQAAVNAVNTKFASIEEQDRKTIDLMERERRASNVMNGLSGSQTGAGRTIQTNNDASALQTKTANQKAAEVAAILADAETRSTEEFHKERDSYLAQQKDKYAAEQTLASRIRDNATAEVGTIAGTMSFDDLQKKNPALVKQYMDELGVDETGLKSIFLSKSKDNLLSDKPEIVGGKAIWFTRNMDGTIGQTSVDIPNAGKEIKDSRITDKGIQVLYTDGTYAVLGGGIGGGGGGNSDASIYDPGIVRKLKQANLTSADPNTRKVFANAPSAFRDTWIRNNGANDNSDVTPQMILHNLDEWEAANKNNGSSNIDALLSKLEEAQPSGN